MGPLPLGCFILSLSLLLYKVLVEEIFLAHFSVSKKTGKVCLKIFKIHLLCQTTCFSFFSMLSLGWPAIRKGLVLVITSLEGWFGLNFSSAFLKISKLPEWNKGNFKIFRNHKGDLSPKSPEPSMWLLVNQSKPTKTVLKLISFNSGQLTLLTVQCWLQSTVWLHQKHLGRNPINSLVEKRVK